MIRANATFGLLVAGGISVAVTAHAQKPTPPLIVVQAANAPAPTSSSAPAAAQDPASTHALVKSLQEIKAANDETLKKQDAALQQLDEMQKAADQIKIFAHRSGG
jgi:hypothetical protein